MDVKMVWIIGGPGSGKTTQAQNIANKYGFVHIEPCTLAKKEGKLDEKVMEAIKRGYHVPLNYIFPLILNKMRSAKAKGIVIDGYPENLEEAELLEVGLGQPDIIIALQVDEITSIRRSLKTARIIDGSALEEYTISSMPVIKKYRDITALVDSCPESHRVLDVIQFNIDSLRRCKR